MTRLVTRLGPGTKGPRNAPDLAKTCLEQPACHLGTLL